MNSPLCKDTVMSLLQSQLTHFLMVEKYGLRADRNSSNPEHIIIPPEEIKSDLDQLFGKNNGIIIESLWWILNDAVATYEPDGWDDMVEELVEEQTNEN